MQNTTQLSKIGHRLSFPLYLPRSELLQPKLGMDTKYQQLCSDVPIR